MTRQESYDDPQEASKGERSVLSARACAQVEAETVAPALDLWWGIHRPSVAALVESLSISCRAEDAWEAADALIGTHPGGLLALDAMIGNSLNPSPPLRQNQARPGDGSSLHSHQPCANCCMQVCLTVRLWI